MHAARPSLAWKTLRIKSIKPRYSNVKAPYSDEQKLLAGSFNPLYARNRDVYDNIPDDVLRWRVSARPSAHVLSKAVLRAHLGRRWKNAFADALRERGYALDGKKIVNGKKIPGLQGTLEIPIRDAKGMDDPYSELLEAAHLTIVMLEKM